MCTPRYAVGLCYQSERERSRSRDAVSDWQQRAGPALAGQGRKPAEPGARSASLDGPAAVRHGRSEAGGGAVELEGKIKGAAVALGACGWSVKESLPAREAALPALARETLTHST